MYLGLGLRLGGLGISGYDADAAAYFDRAGVTDATAKQQINAFVVGVKGLGLWNNMVCWPLRSAQNKGSGTTAYSLGGVGTYNGTLNNSPTWGTDGLTNSATGFVKTSFPWATTHTGIIVCSQTSTAGLQTALLFGDSIFGSASGRRTNMRLDSNLFLFNGSYTSYAFGPSSLNAFRMSGYGLISATSLLGYNNGSTSTISSSPINMSGGTGTNNFSFMAANEDSGGASQYLVGTCAFATAFNIQLSSGQFSSFNSLYKTTLGTGLGLP